MNQLIENDTELTDEELEAKLAAWDAQQREALDVFATAWDAHAALIRRRNRRVALITGQDMSR